MKGGLLTLAAADAIIEPDGVTGGARHMARTKGFYDLRDALRRPGCPVCRLKADAVDRFLDGLLWESVNDPGQRRKIRRAQGFCRDHAWALVRTSASLGVAIITRDVLQDLLRAVEGLSSRSDDSVLGRVWGALGHGEPALAAHLEPRADCPACVWVEKVEDAILSTLVEGLLGEDGLLADYEASEGLCLPHFRRAVARVRDRKVLEALVNGQRVIWGRLVAQLDESIRKSDHRFLEEEWGEETGAWLRAIAALVGPRPGSG